MQQITLVNEYILNLKKQYFINIFILLCILNVQKQVIKLKIGRYVIKYQSFTIASSHPNSNYY